MQMKVLLIGAGALLVARSFYKKYQLYDQSNFLLQKISVSGPVFKPIVNIDVQIQNPTSAQVEISELIGKLYLNDIYAADVMQISPVAVVPGKSVMYLKATPKWNIVDALLSAIKTQRGAFSLVGTLRVNNILTPFIKKYQLG